MNGLKGVVKNNTENCVYIQFESREAIDITAPEFLTSITLTKQANELLAKKLKSLT